MFPILERISRLYAAARLAGLHPISVHMGPEQAAEICRVTGVDPSKPFQLQGLHVHVSPTVDGFALGYRLSDDWLSQVGVAGVAPVHVAWAGIPLAARTLPTHP